VVIEPHGPQNLISGRAWFTISESAMSASLERVRRPPACSSLRVVHLSPAYFSENSCIGGGERYVTELALAMAKLVRTTLVSFGRRPCTYVQEGLRFVILRPQLLLDGNLMGPVSTEVVREMARADVVHCHQVVTPLGDLAVLANLVFRRALFGTDLGGGMRHLGRRFGSVQRFRHIHISSFSAGLGREGCLPGPVIYGGACARRSAGSSARDPAKVVTIGRLLPHKGANYVISAAEPHWNLWVIGRSYDTRYEALLRQLAQHPGIRIVTDATDADLAFHLESASIAVFPSVTRDVFGGSAPHAELLGLALIEAMSAGCCVIASDICSHPEIVRHGETGFLVPEGNAEAIRDCVDRLIADPALARRMGEAARQRTADFFSWDATARRCLDAYRRAGVRIP
jgi:glycosyltransferase involved in cell wall biosynthesis